MMFSDCVPRYSGMRAPADIGQQAGGLAVARLLLGLVDAEGGERLRRSSPPVRAHASTERARSSASSLGGRDQRIGALLVLRQQREQEALAHAERRDTTIFDGFIAAMISCSTAAP